MMHTAETLTGLPPEKKKRVRHADEPHLGYFAFVLLCAFGLWLVDAPEGLETQAWHLFIIFLATIVSVMLKVMPMAALALCAIGTATLTHTLTLEESLSSFSSPITWLIVFAFLIARGFIITGLGSRIAYFFISLLGKSTLGLAYGFVLTEAILALFIPSSAARGGGIIFPVIQALNAEYQSTPELGTERNMGSYLMKVCFQANVISSTLFLTAIASNPLVVSFASQEGLTLTWGQWALMTIVPALCCLFAMPLVLYFLYPPQIKRTPHAPEIARDKLAHMGSLKFKEGVMLFTFVLLLALWMGSKTLHIDPTVTALVGVLILLFSGVLTWTDILSEKGAWDTMIWFAILLSLANFLGKFGMMAWAADHIETFVSDWSWEPSLLVLLLVFFYSHYFFASVTAHVAALFGVFFAVAVATGAPPGLALALLGGTSALFGCLTHYGTGPAPIFFGAGYVSLRDWWVLGAILSILYLSIWGVIGSAWWKVLGIW